MTRSRHEGQGLIEYAMILFFVSIVMAGALMLLGSTLDESFYQLAAEVFR